MAQVALAQEPEPLPSASAVAAALESKEATALTEMLGTKVELTDVNRSRMTGLLGVAELAERLAGCTASYKPDQPERAYSITIAYDCPQAPGFAVSADCASEDWTLYITRRSAGEVARTGTSTPVAVLGPKRSNEGACYLAPLAPPSRNY
jgi:hypothetical protein